MSEAITTKFSPAISAEDGSFNLNNFRFKEDYKYWNVIKIEDKGRFFRECFPQDIEKVL